MTTFSFRAFQWEALEVHGTVPIMGTGICLKGTAEYPGHSLILSGANQKFLLGLPVFPPIN